MQLVASETHRQPAFHDFAGTPLCVVFAEGDAIEALRSAGEGTLQLEPPYHVSDEDAYLVLPDDIGVEIVDILRDGDLELLHEALQDGLLALGAVVRQERGRMALHVEVAFTPAEVLGGGLPYSATVAVGAGEDPVRTANEMDCCQCTMLSALLDDEGLERMLREAEFLGASWRVPAAAAHRLVGVEPTYAWSRRRGPGRVGVELALFIEEEELVVLLRPVELVAG